MTEKEIQSLKDDVNGLLQLPNASRALKHRILEIKESLAVSIDHFRGSNASDDMEQNRPVLKGVRFEISRMGDNLWIASVPGSFFPDIKVNDIIPDQVVRYISGKDVEEGVIFLERGLRFPGLKDRVFNISYEKNKNFIRGVIDENNADSFNFFSPENLSQEISKMCQGGENQGENDEAKIEVIKNIIYHLVNSDKFFSHVASEFFCHWKPLFDNELLEKFATISKSS